MDLGKFFGTIGSDVGGFFNGIGNALWGNDDQRRRQQQAQQAQQRSFTSQPQQQPQQSGVQQPNSLTPQNNNQPPAPKLGGVGPLGTVDDFLGGVVHNIKDKIGEVGHDIGLGNPQSKQPPQPQQPQPHFDPGKGIQASVNSVGDLFNHFVPDVQNAVGGAIKGIGDQFNTVRQQGQIGLQAQAGNNGNPLVDQHYLDNQNAAIDQAVKSGGITPDQAATLRQNAAQHVAQSQQALHQAEGQVGVKYDPSAGALSTVDIASNLLGGDELLKGLFGQLAKRTATRAATNDTIHGAEAEAAAQAQQAAEQPAVQTQSLHANEAGSVPGPTLEEPVAPPVRTAGGDPNSPITVTPTSGVKPPAITSPNRPSEPTQLAPAQPTVAPGGIKPPTLEQPVLPAQPVAAPVAQQEEQAVQQALDKATTTPEPAPAPVENTVVQPASTKAAKKVAAETPQVTPEQIQQAVKAESEKSAPATATPFDNKTEIDQINRILKNEDTVAGGEKIGDYYRNSKGEDWKTVNMAPDEYLQRAAKAMGMNTPEDIARWIERPMGNPEEYAAAMKNGDKFPMAWINERAGSQEGRTRALAAKLAGEKEIPVALGEKYDPNASPVVSKEALDKAIPAFADAPKEVPQYTPPVKNGKASVPGTNNVKYTTGDPNLDGILHDSIIAHKGTAGTSATRADALDAAGISQAQRAQIRNIATKNVDKTTGKISPDAVEQIKDILTGKTEAPKSAPVGDVPPAEEPALSGEATPPTQTGRLGTITREAVRDGSINTTEGVAKAESDTEAAAHAAAEAAGTTIDDIIKKGQAAWEASQAAGKDLTTKEAAEQVEGFTPEQQQVYKDYAQELHTLRDRSGHSLKGGNQGAWYGPRQFLDGKGKSGEYDPSLVNENKRTGVKTSSNGNGLDYSPTQYSYYIRRYANAVDAGSQRIVGAAEDAGVKIPDTAKEQLENSLKQITDARDAADRQLAETGDAKTARASQKEVQKAIRQTFNDFIDNIPGSGSARREAINNVKAMRGTYEQTLTQTMTTSNLVNRLADQGTKAVESMKRPLVHALEKPINRIMKGHAMEGADVNALNTSKEARQAAKEFSRGTLGSEIMDNAKATVANAGAGRNPLMKGIAKADATVRAAGGALTQTGDLSTSNVRDALEIGASRAGAAGLKTVEDYKKYFADYTKTQNFKDDLAKVEELQNKKAGLAGGEVQENGGTISNGLSKHVDNFISTQADRIKPGLGKNRLIREGNDYIKGDVTGYAGVTSRVLRSVKDAVVPYDPIFKSGPLNHAVKEAGSGDPAAVARATKIAAHAVADSIALYGSAGAAALAAGSGIVGFTGAQPTQGSSESAYNKAHTVPANQWYVNLPGGKRVYFDPARPFAGPGIAADVAGTLATGAKDVGGALTDTANQVFNQAGGNSIPQNIINAYNGYLNPSATDADKKYGKTQTESLLAPSTGVLNNVANWMDSVKRAPGNFIEDLQSNLPGQRPSVPAATDSLGNVIPNSHQVSGGSSIFSIGDNPTAAQADGSKADPIASEISRLQDAGQKNVMPTNANTNATSDKNGGSNQEYAKLLVNDPMYQKADDKTKADMLHNILIGKANGVNDKLATPDKQALIDHLLQGSDAKVWMENNDNAVNYLTAKYNNDDANGNLTTAQKDMNHKGSLAQQVAIAKVNQQFNVDQDTINGYSDTSKGEFNNLADGSEEKNRLLAYDEALAKAGLPSKYQNKYGGYGSSGKGGNGPSNFAFPSLPASLTGTGSGSKSGSGGYAEGKSLFTPLPALVAPTTANIPKGRSISVKPGVSL